MALDRFSDVVEQTLDAGEATMRNAAAVIADLDSSLDRTRSILAGADDTLNLVRRASDSDTA